MGGGKGASAKGLLGEAGGRFCTAATGLVEGPFDSVIIDDTAVFASITSDLIQDIGGSVGIVYNQGYTKYQVKSFQLASGSATAYRPQGTRAPLPA